MEETSDPVLPPSPGPENSSSQEVLFITSTAGDDDEGVESCQATRSYECTFCKRGFSNAQALGGHMNIHRKDKVKLNLNQTSLSNRIFRAHHHQFPKPTPSPLYCEIPPITTIKPLESKSSTRMFSLEGDEVSRDEASFGENRQLLFLAETSSHDENQEPPSGREEGFEQLGPELDLELRLGHDEPQPSNTGLKKFF